jgi:hypothetical protein
MKQTPPKVFVSYRQENLVHKKRVLSFALTLSSAGVDVILDQLYQKKKAGGPPEGWDQW